MEFFVGKLEATAEKRVVIRPETALVISSFRSLRGCAGPRLHVLPKVGVAPCSQWKILECDGQSIAVPLMKRFDNTRKCAAPGTLEAAEDHQVRFSVLRSERGIMRGDGHKDW